MHSPHTHTHTHTHTFMNTDIADNRIHTLIRTCTLQPAPTKVAWYVQTDRTFQKPHSVCRTMTSCVLPTYAYAFREGSWEKWEFWEKTWEETHNDTLHLSYLC